MNQTKIAQQVYDANQTRDQFGLAQTSFHVHNGSDSPFIYMPNFPYIGQVGMNAENILLPGGWTVTVSGVTGAYEVTHKLNTIQYAVTASIQLEMGAVPCTPLFDQDERSFRVTWYDATGTVQSNAFNFILVLTTNTQGSGDKRYTGTNS